MQCSIVLTQVRKTLNDPSAVTWTDSSDLIPALNDALRALVAVRPDAAAATTTHLLTAGTKQSIPTDGVRLLKVIRNRGEDGLSSAGRVIKKSDINIQDMIFPEWHEQTGQTIIREYFYDPIAPREFWVFPPASGAPVIGVELSYVKTLTAISATTDTFPVDDFFAPAVQEWMLYRLMSSDDEASPNYQAAQAHKSTFFDLLGVKSKADAAANPGVKPK